MTVVTSNVMKSTGFTVKNFKYSPIFDKLFIPTCGVEFISEFSRELITLIALLTEKNEIKSSVNLEKYCISTWFLPI